jgi:hypothetical protein
MSTTNKTFSVKNGIDVANTLIISNVSGVINVSNITLANVVTLNASGNVYSGNTIAGVPITGLGGVYSSFASINANTYGGVVVQNFSNGTYASADLVAINNIGNDSVFFVDVGINSNTESDPFYPALLANDAYLICQGNVTTSNLSIGTLTPLSNLIFFVGGNANSNIAATISPNAGGGGTFTVNGNLVATRLSLTYPIFIPEFYAFYSGV